MGWTVREGLHTDLGESSDHPRLQFRAAQPGRGGPEGNVLADRGHEELVVGVLEDDADPAADLREVRLGDRQPATERCPRHR